MRYNLCFHNLKEELLFPIKELEDFLDFRITSYEEADIYVNTEGSDRELCVVRRGDQATISYHRQVELFRGLGILLERLQETREDRDFTMKESAAFSNLCYMQDNSRNAVSNPGAVHKMIRHLALMGYHSFMLYTEDTYEVEGYPFFGYMRGRFTKDELKEINAYAAMFGIEMIPCIQTLAHLNAAFHWYAFDEVKDIADILLCGEPKTYELIEAMIKTCSEVFTSRSINIGMDEAELLGLGKYLKRHGHQERFQIMLEHLHKVLSICDKYGMQAMMWSDMFFKLLSGNSDHYYTAIEISEQVKERIPKNVKLIYWDYYSRDKSIYDSMFDRHKQLTDQICFAGGAWRWTGFAPLLGHSTYVSELALQSCNQHGISEVIVTGWGDNGSETSTFAIGPILQLYAEYCYTRALGKEQVERRLNSCMHMNYRDFYELDTLNLTPDNPAPGGIGIAPSKYLLYQDVLMGLFDKHIDELTYPKHYEKGYKTLAKISEKKEEYSYIFDTLAKLAHILSIKCDLGIRLKRAYDRKDREALMIIADQCIELLGRMEAFHEALRYQWHLESKPFGFDVLDIRIGGLKERIRSANVRIKEYLNGSINQIDELEQERLELNSSVNPGHRTIPVYHNEWKTMVTASIL